MINRRHFNGLAGGSIAALLAGIRPTSAADDIERVIIGIDGDIKTFNILQRFDNSWFPSTLYFERLTAMDYGPEFKIRPQLAKSWEVSDDGLVYTFRLQEGVTWHDGAPFTSRDVKYTFETIVANNTYSAPPLKVISSIETPDDLTLILRMSRPSASFMPAIATYPRFAILPAHLYEGKSWDDHPNNMNPVGTGPFRFQEHRPGEYIAFTRYDGYWGEKPAIKQVIYRIIPEPNIQVAQLQSGEIHALNNPPPLAMEPILNNFPGCTVDSPAGPMTYYLAFNVTKAPFDKAEVRQALARAIDRNVLAERASLGIYRPAAGTYVSAIDWAFDDNVRLPTLDLAKAGEMLDAAGYPLNGGIRFAFDLWVSRPTEITSAQIIREQLKAIGVDVRINQMEDILMRSTMPKLEHAAYIYGNWWGPDPSEWAQYTVSKGPWNHMGYSNPEVDKLFDEGDLALTEDGRKAAYSAIQKILLEEMPRVPLFDSGPYSFARRTDLTGWFSEDPVSYRSDLRRVRKAT